MARPSSQETVRGRVGDQSEWSGRRGGPESEAGTVPPRPGLSLGDWIALLTCRLGIWAGPGVAQRRVLGRAFAGKPVYEGPWVYEPDTRLSQYSLRPIETIILDHGSHMKKATG